jgi:hypothetical protein
MTTDQVRQATEMALSWVRVFLAASLAVWLATGQFDWTTMWQSGAAAVLPVIIRYLDPQDKTYGRVGDE